MSITYKIVSDWNLKTDFSESEDTKGIIKIASDPLLSSSNTGGPYDLYIDSIGVKHGVFSKSSVYDLYYFTYSNGEVSLEQITINDQGVSGVNPKVIVSSLNDIVVIYYDLETFSLSMLKKSLGTWVVEEIDYVNIESPYANSKISLNSVGDKIYISMVYDFDNEQSVLKYLYYDGSKWFIEIVDNDESNNRYLSTAIVNDSSGNPFIFLGTSSSIEVYERRSGSWKFERTYSQNSPIYEIDASYDYLNYYSHLSYICGSELRYQRYNHSISRALNRFFITHRFIDFNSSSISIDINGDGNPAISYSHVEEGVPTQVYLKIARSSDLGSTFKNYNIEGSSTAEYSGYLSNLKFNSDEKIYIIYYDNGIRLYDEQKDIDEDNITTNIWKDRTYRNNLIASDNSPTRDSENTYMQFTKSNEECFYIDNDSVVDLDNVTTEFSILFIINPSGETPSAQTIVSKASSDSGYEIFLGGSKGLTLGINIYTIYESLSTLVVDLPAKETSKVAIVYSGYDVKFYIKTPQDNFFKIYKYNIFGDLKNNINPFVIGAYGVKNDVENGPYYPYPVISNTYTFTNFLDGKILNLKYWKRELKYEEVTYADSSLSSYRQYNDPFSDNLDYATLKSSSGSRHFVTYGEYFSSKDYGGANKINLISYSDFNSEDRITNSSAYSVDPFIVKRKKGGMSLVWSDKETGYSEIYINNFNSNNATNYLSENNSSIRYFGNSGKVTINTNIFSDPKANFYDSGVNIGDFLSIVSGTNYIGRRVPVLEVLNETTLKIGVYFSFSEDSLGYYIDSLDYFNNNDVPVKLTDLKQTSIKPVAISDTMNDIHIIYQSLGDEYYDIYYQRYRPGYSENQILGSVQLTSKEGNSENPSIAIDSNNIIHLVWEDSRNKKHSVMYGRSSSTTTDGDANYVEWTTSNFNGKDIIISGDLYSEDPNMFIDNNDVIHIVFSAKINDKYEIYYCSNETGVFSNPLKISEFGKISKNPVIVVDKNMNRYVIFSCKFSFSEEIYITKYDYFESKWNSPKRISFSDKDSINPSVCIDSDNIIYIYWIEKDENSKSIGHAEYDIDKDEVVPIDIRPSSVPTSIEKISVALDESKTTYLAWEDSRLGTNIGSEIYRNNSVNLIYYNEIEEDEDEQDKTESEIISQQLNKFVIGKQYDDDVSSSILPLSDEAPNDVIITFETDSKSFEVPVDIYNLDNPLKGRDNIVLDSRDIKIKIKGLSRTLAYRIKNLDDTSSNYSEFYEFTIDIVPDTTVANWRLSSENGLKQIAIQLYTLEGLVSPIVIDLYLNEPDVYDIYIYNDDGGDIGTVVSTEYQNIKALSYNKYWVLIKPYKVIGDDQKVQFDVITQGNDLNNIDTQFNGQYYVGHFSVNVHDGVRYIDGNAKIVPKIVKK